MPPSSHGAAPGFHGSPERGAPPEPPPAAAFRRRANDDGSDSPGELSATGLINPATGWIVAGAALNALAHHARAHSSASQHAAECHALFRIAVHLPDGEVRDAALAEALVSGQRVHCLALPDLSHVELARLCARAAELGLAADYVRALVRANRLTAPTPDSENWPWAVRVYTLGRFALVVEGAPVCFARKPQKRTLALLQALIAFGGRDVEEWRLAEALTAPGEDCAKALAMPLMRLRKLMGHVDAVHYAAGKFSVNPAWCWVDVWAFERGARHVEAAVFERSLHLYAAPFLAREPEQAWMLRLRARLQDRFEAAVRRIGERHENAGEFGRAADIYRRALDTDAASEPLWRSLMRCLAAAGEPAEAIRVYQRCRSQLATALGIAPSSETEALRRRIVANAVGGSRQELPVPPNVIKT